MNAVDHFRRLLDYDAHANSDVLKSLRALKDAGRTDAPFREALNGLGHIMATRRLWLYRLGRVDDPPSELHSTRTLFGRLEAELVEMAGLWSDFALALDQEELERVFIYGDTDGARVETSVASALVHVVDHASYNRGQIASLIVAAGGTPPENGYAGFVGKVAA